MTPTLNYRPKVNLKDNNNLTMVVSNENIDTGKSDPGRMKSRITRQEIPHIIT